MRSHASQQSVTAKFPNIIEKYAAKIDHLSSPAVES
jgi:hypothetical protein